MKIPHKIAIFGATSEIAQEIAKPFAAHGTKLILLGRNEILLDRIAKDLIVRGAPIAELHQFDATNKNALQITTKTLLKKHPDLDGLILAHGFMSQKEGFEILLEEIEKTTTVNYNSYVHLVYGFLSHFKQLNRGTITIISSVAGDRGRRRNWAYGASKAAVSALASGLRQELAKHSVTVLTVKPGSVATAMTAHLQKTPLFASAELVGHKIYKAMLSGKENIYIPGYWRLILLITKNLPEFLFKHLKF